MENRLVLAGRVIGPVRLRHSPSGIAIARFTLGHDSVQHEAGHARRIAFRIGIVAAGEELGRRAAGLHDDAAVRISGFLSRSGYRDDENRLVFHAERIESLPPGAEPAGPRVD